MILEITSTTNNGLCGPCFHKKKHTDKPLLQRISEFFSPPNVETKQIIPVTTEVNHTKRRRVKGKFEDLNESITILRNSGFIIHEKYDAFEYHLPMEK